MHAYDEISNSCRRKGRFTDHFLFRHLRPPLPNHDCSFLNRHKFIEDLVLSVSCSLITRRSLGHEC